jgi:hypothetical protein
MKSHGSAVSIVTGDWLNNQNAEVRAPVGLRIFTSPYHPDWLWDPYPMGTGALSLGGGGVKVARA